MTAGYVCVNVPRKGDAWDYFQAGGTVQDLGEVTEVITTEIGVGAWSIWVPDDSGPIQFTIENAEPGNDRAINCDLTVEPWSPLAHGRRISHRINLMSASARDQLARRYKTAFEIETNWVIVINDAFTAAAETWHARGAAINVEDIDPQEDVSDWLIPGMLPLGEPAVLFGDGGTGKGYVALTLAVCVAAGVPFLGHDSQPMRVLYVDWESNARRFHSRVQRIKQELGLQEPVGIWYFDPEGDPLTVCVERIRREVEEHDSGLVILDSAAVACDGAPEKSEVTTRFNRALSKMGADLTVLIVAHVNRGVDGPTPRAAKMRPFGSVFWHDLARATCYVEKVQDPGDPALRQVLINRKMNDGPPAPSIFTVFEFDGETGPVTLSGLKPGQAPRALAAERPLAHRISDVLHEGALPLNEITEAINGDLDDGDKNYVKPDTIGRTLRRSKTRFVRVDGDRWGLLDPGPHAGMNEAAG